MTDGYYNIFLYFALAECFEKQYEWLRSAQYFKLHKVISYPSNVLKQ